MSAAQKILVADDSLTIRKLVESVLTQQGYEVITAETAAECLAKACEQKPDLILLDYVLPDKQGTELCRELINSPVTWEIPVLMMSSNGNAIRQLYHDLNNVADYLTKPFAPSVLTAVVGHLLARPKPGENGETSATTPTPTQPVAAQAVPEAAVPREFMDKVTRLLDLMETKPGAENVPAAEAATAEDTAPAKPAPPAKPKARRSRKPVASVPASEAVLRKIRLAVQKHLRLRIRQIPDWETNLGGAEAEDFLLGRLLAKDVLSDLAADLMRATGMPPEAAGALRCPVGLVALDVILRHLHSGRMTGELRIETGAEVVTALLQSGEVVFLTTNNPRNYCAGATCDFQAVPHAIIGEAVRAQEEQSLPFFVSLQNSGHLPAGTSLEELLVNQGTKSLVRAFKANDATISFFPLTRLPAMIRSAKLSLPLNQLLLACYRSVDDWFTLERAFTEMDATFVPTHEMDDQIRELQLDEDEQRLIEAIRPGRTMQELAEAMELKPFEVCRYLFRFVKLGIVRNGPRRDHDERVDDDIATATATSTIVTATPVETQNLNPAETTIPSNCPPPTADSPAETPEEISAVEPAPLPMDPAPVASHEPAPTVADNPVAASQPDTETQPAAEPAIP